MSIYDISKKVIEDKISKGSNFSVDEINEEIKKLGGVCRISPGITIKDYMKTLEKMGIVEFNSYDDTYIIFDENLVRRINKAFVS